MREAVAGSENNYLEVFVGRGPATKVADARCSRKQLAMVADTQKCRLYFSLVHSESYKSHCAGKTAIFQTSVLYIHPCSSPRTLQGENKTERWEQQCCRWQGTSQGGRGGGKARGQGGDQQNPKSVNVDRR